MIWMKKPGPQGVVDTGRLPFISWRIQRRRIERPVHVFSGKKQHPRQEKQNQLLVRLYSPHSTHLGTLRGVDDQFATPLAARSVREEDAVNFEA